MPSSPDDLAALKAERAAADREYNEALTRLDLAIQQLPANFPHPPPGPDEQQITPYVDTRDRDVAGLLRGLSGAINAVGDEAMKRSEALLARERRHDLRVSDLEAQLATLGRQMAEIQQALEKRGAVDR